jgi:hypothetical protein
MKTVGVLTLIDVPDETTPEQVAKMAPRIIDGGLQLVDQCGPNTSDWRQRRLFVLSDAHREAFTRCLTQEDSS